MKRIIAVLLMAAVALTVSGCGKEEGENSSSQTSNTVSEENSTVSSSSPAVKANEAITILDKEDIPDGFPSPVSGTFNGQTISMGLVAVPEINWEDIESYKSHKQHVFYNGFAILSLKPPSYLNYYIGKKGEIIGGYRSLHRFNKKGRVLVLLPDDSYAYMDTTGKIVAPGSKSYEEFHFEGDTEGVDIRMQGEPGSYYFQLYDADGNLLNERKFDYITPFYNNLALIEKDYKIGLIDKKGNIVIEPSFPYDETEYPGSNWQYDPHYINEDLTIIPINGKVGVLGITRSQAFK